MESNVVGKFFIIIAVLLSFFVLILNILLIILLFVDWFQEERLERRRKELGEREYFIDCCGCEGRQWRGEGDKYEGYCCGEGEREEG